MGAGIPGRQEDFDVILCLICMEKSVLIVLFLGQAPAM